MVVWTDALKAKFLVTTLQEITPSVSRETWKRVAQKLGPEFTVEACRQTFAKMLKASASDSGSGTATPSTRSPGTPKSTSRKRKAATPNDECPSKAAASAKKQRKTKPIPRLSTPENDDADADGEMLTPETPSVQKLVFDESD